MESKKEIRTVFCLAAFTEVFFPKIGFHSVVNTGTFEFLYFIVQHFSSQELKGWHNFINCITCNC